ncbi:hypothetical protein NGRA_2950 [Nosema granulosis]|uniref:PSP1 C-terminal domain-containing protein n=1 Tax=Nosema granulosis TaxID=83296 RepID=A0A9P6KY50_9MICR|nr:hypothetical protein NGRA_2950 [Nosema granulosis]
MSKYDNWSSPFFNSLWSDTNETWKEPLEDWRIVGTNPFRRRSKSINDCGLEVKKTPGTTTESLYVVEFGSKRLDLAYIDFNHLITTNTYVILEADRGEDCGRIIGTASKEDFDRLVRKHENIIHEVNPKRIHRMATEEDFRTLEKKKEMERNALEFCAAKCREKNLHMKVVDCEYQWDLNKITFYFDSDDRIDFRELVKELYKIYKTRIWMCSIEKSKNRHLRELVMNKC